MKIQCVAVAALSCVLSTGVAAQAATCQQVQEPGSATVKVKESSIALVAVEPLAGGDVRRETIITVDLEYRIAGFEAGRFFVMATFPTFGNRAMSPGEEKDRLFLESAAGKLRLCVPLKEVYEAEDVSFPLRMRLSLYRAEGDGTSVAVTSMRSLQFQSPDAPGRNLELQAARPPQEYYDALTQVSGFLNGRSALYKTCIERFPARQPTLTPAYRAWEGRHMEQIEMVSLAQFGANLEHASGRADIAARIEDTQAKSLREFHARMPVEKLGLECDRIIEDAIAADDLTDDAISDEIEIVRKYWRSAPDGRKR